MSALSHRPAFTRLIFAGPTGFRGTTVYGQKAGPALVQTENQPVLPILVTFSLGSGQNNVRKTLPRPIPFLTSPICGWRLKGHSTQKDGHSRDFSETTKRRSRPVMPRKSPLGCCPGCTDARPKAKRLPILLGLRRRPRRPTRIRLFCLSPRRPLFTMVFG